MFPYKNRRTTYISNIKDRAQAGYTRTQKCVENWANITERVLKVDLRVMNGQNMIRRNRRIFPGIH